MSKKATSRSTEDSSSERCLKIEEEDELNVKPHCECTNCAHWSTSPDWHVNNVEFDNKKDGSKPVVLERFEAPPLLKTKDNSSSKPIKMFPFNYSSLSRIDKLTTHKKIFIHSQITISPIKSLTDTSFPKDIQMGLKNYLKLNEPTNLQSFVWAAMYKHLNVCIIHNRKNNFLTYLPIVCSFTLDSENYAQLNKYKGPLVIILCNDSRKCEELFDVIKYKMFITSKYKPKVSVLTYPTINVNNVDILITMPTVLIECLKNRMFNLKRLYYLIIEDANKLLKVNKEPFSRICTTINEMLTNRKCNQKVRLILNSEKWTTDLENFLKLMHSMPFICFENYLEAVLYAKVHLELKYIMSNNKMHYLSEILKNYRINKTMVLCDNSEIEKVAEYLRNHKIDVIAINDSEKRMQDLERQFQATKGGLHKVLLCNDEILNATLTITNADTLIHYSFPETWDLFTKRFKCLVEHFSCPFSNEDKSFCKSFLLIDETNEAKLPKIFNLLHRLDNNLPEILLNYEQQLINQINDKKLLNHTKICNNLKLFGSCTKSLCEFRHLSHEAIDVSYFLPKNGEITFKIIDMITVTRFTVQLIENTDLDGNLIKYQQNRNEPICFNIDKKQMVPKSEIQFGTVYVYYDPLINNYFPCEVLEINENNLRILVLNTGKCDKTNVSKLFFTPKHFQWNQNSSVVEIYLANFRPPHNDKQFSSRAEFETRKILEKANYRKVIFTANVNLQLNKTLWLDDIKECLTIDKVNLVGFNLIKNLVKFKLIEYNGKQLENFQKITGCKLAEKKIQKQNIVVKKNVITTESEPNWAFLDKEEIQEVYFVCAINPDEFYVRRTKYYNLLLNLEEDILESEKKGLLKNSKGILKIIIGKYYLAPSPDLLKLSRCQVLKIENDDVLVLYVDYGDEAVLKLSDLKYLPQDFLMKLPFQAIQCNLYGLSPIFEEWSENATNVLYKYMYETNSEYFRCLYVKVCKVENCTELGTKRRYTILLKDGFHEKNILINQLLIECGLARQDLEIVDFEIPVMESGEKGNDDKEEIEEIVRQQEEDVVINGYKFNEDEFDLEIMDMMEFFKELPVKVKPLDKPALQSSETTTEVTIKSSLPTLEIKGDYYKPYVRWSQTNENVILKVELTDVVKYSVKVLRKRNLKFETNLNEKIYKLNINLYKPVELLQHKNCTREILITLKKSEVNLEWPKLSESKLNNCRYEFSHLELDEPKHRRILEGLPDLSDDSDDSNGPMYLVESEQDSEFDQELESDD